MDGGLKRQVEARPIFFSPHLRVSLHFSRTHLGSPAMKYLYFLLPIFGLANLTVADEAVKGLLPVFGKPLAAAKLPKDPLTRAQVELGRTLYHEKRLSRDN